MLAVLPSQQSVAHFVLALTFCEGSMKRDRWSQNDGLREAWRRIRRKPSKFQECIFNDADRPREAVREWRGGLAWSHHDRSTYARSSHPSTSLRSLSQIGAQTQNDRNLRHIAQSLGISALDRSPSRAGGTSSSGRSGKSQFILGRQRDALRFQGLFGRTPETEIAKLTTKIHEALIGDLQAARAGGLPQQGRPRDFTVDPLRKAAKGNFDTDCDRGASRNHCPLRVSRGGHLARLRNPRPALVAITHCYALQPRTPSTRLPFRSPTRVRFGPMLCYVRRRENWEVLHVAASSRGDRSSQKDLGTSPRISLALAMEPRVARPDRPQKDIPLFTVASSETGGGNQAGYHAARLAKDLWQRPVCGLTCGGVGVPPALLNCHDTTKLRELLKPDKGSDAESRPANGLQRYPRTPQRSAYDHSVPQEWLKENFFQIDREPVAASRFFPRDTKGAKPQGTLFPFTPEPMRLTATGFQNSMRASVGLAGPTSGMEFRCWSVSLIRCAVGECPAEPVSRIVLRRDHRKRIAGRFFYSLAGVSPVKTGQRL